MEQTIYKEFGVLGYWFKFMDQHPTLSSVILAIEALLAVYAVLTYNFTTNV